MGSILSSPLVPNLSNKRVDPLEDLLLEKLPITKDWGHKVWLDKQKIGGYSVVNTEYKSGHSELKYLDIPLHDMSYDLLNGYTIDYNCEHECVMSFTAGKLLQWISNEGQEFMVAGDRLLDTDFVSGRWLLSYIMTFPYERMSSKILLATKFRGNIYMCWKNHSAFNTASIDDSLKHNFSERRFKQYLTTSAHDPSRDRNQFDPDFSYYNAVVRTQLCNSRNSGVYHSLMYSFPIDCILPDVMPETAALEDFAEIRTKKEGTEKTPFKRLRLWTEAYLKGVSTIYFGHKDTNFVVNKVERVETFDLLYGWQRDVCFNFLNTFLSYVKEVVTIDDPYVVYRFDLVPNESITCTRLAEPGEYQVLPDWYIKEFKI